MEFEARHRAGKRVKRLLSSPTELTSPFIFSISRAVSCSLFSEAQYKGDHPKPSVAWTCFGETVSTSLTNP